MKSITIRNLPEATYRALMQRAALHGCGTQTEILSILEEAVRPAGRIKLGSELAAFGRRFNGIELDIDRDKTPA